MSHFTVMVIGENPEEQFAPFDETIEVPEYRREEVSEKEIASFMGVYAEYKQGREYGAKSVAVATANKAKSFDELYEEYGNDWNSGSWRKDENGVWGEYSTYNPQSKWDWYVLGGRWSGLIQLKEGTKGIEGESGVGDNKTGIDAAKKGDIANLSELSTFAVLKDGVWYEKGVMGWWGMVSNSKDQKEWDNQIKKLLTDLPDDTLISIYDCHI